MRMQAFTDVRVYDCLRTLANDNLEWDKTAYRHCHDTPCELKVFCEFVFFIL